MTDEFEDDDYVEHFRAVAYTNMPGDGPVQIGYGKTSKKNPDVINLRILALPLPNHKGQTWLVIQPYEPNSDKFRNE